MHNGSIRRTYPVLDNNQVSLLLSPNIMLKQSAQNVLVSNHWLKLELNWQSKFVNWILSCNHWENAKFQNFDKLQSQLIAGSLKLDTLS